MNVIFELNRLQGSKIIYIFETALLYLVNNSPEKINYNQFMKIAGSFDHSQKY